MEKNTEKDLYVYHRVASPYNRNEHSIVNQLDSNKVKKKKPAARTVVNGHRKLVEGEGAVGSNTQQREELLAVCRRHQDQDIAKAHAPKYTVAEISKPILEINYPRHK